MEFEVTGHSGRQQVYTAADAEDAKAQYIAEHSEPARWVKIVPRY